MSTIQLPTSADLLLDQVIRQHKFTKAFDVKRPGPAIHYPQFLATFNKEAELDRLAGLADALSSGVRELRFA